MTDLIVVAADKDAQFALAELLGRHRDLKIRPITFDVKEYYYGDPGVFKSAQEFLRDLKAIDHYRYAIAIFDLDGSGQEKHGREFVEAKVEERLAANGWENRCAAIVIVPELESWLWDASLQVSKLLKFQLRARNAWIGKPEHPKEEFKAALSHSKIQRSSALYQQLARQFPFESCGDPSFRKLVTTLQAWFPA
ncbi:MAG TPA: hypothetical protein VML19_09620 [Verrucomicrobiae bacterium]|nr:hypothetical protein [Verrucomicrobiae bacterium]